MFYATNYDDDERSLPRRRAGQLLLAKQTQIKSYFTTMSIDIRRQCAQRTQTIFASCPDDAIKQDEKR